MASHVLHALQACGHHQVRPLAPAAMQARGPPPEHHCAIHVMQGHGLPQDRRPVSSAMRARGRPRQQQRLMLYAFNALRVNILPSRVRLQISAYHVVLARGRLWVPPTARPA